MRRSTARRHVPAVVAALVATAALLASAAALAPAASAATERNGVCESGEFCYSFNSGFTGSVSDFADSVGDYGSSQPDCFEFRSSGNGQGQCVKNHAASVWNRTGKPVTVFFNSGFDGSTDSDVVDAGAKRDLKDHLKNNNASHRIGGGTGTGGTSCHSDGSNTTLPSTILVYRVKLDRVESVSFRTYVKNVLPNEWISSWPEASLRSGAIAVKSYGWYQALHSTKTTADGRCYDVKDDTNDQVYAPGSAVSSTSSAVDATWDVRLSRGGAVLNAHYCASETQCPAYVDGDWMSQNGSRVLATQGKGYRTILQTYYDDISISG